MKFFLCVATLFISVSVFSQTAHINKKVSLIHSGDTRDCFFFQLEGVNEADSVNPNNPWFAFEFDKVSSDAALSILMAAKASNTLVKVSTTGSGICGGYAEVTNIQWMAN